MINKSQETDQSEITNFDKIPINCPALARTMTFSFITTYQPAKVQIMPG